MKFFLDTANIEEIREAAALGVISGITTNPSLAAKERIGDQESYKAAILTIAQIINGPISVEVTALDANSMVHQAEEIITWHPNVVVKLPSTLDGFKAMAVIRQKSIPINQTLCFSVNQALLGAELGVRYVNWELALLALTDDFYRRLNETAEQRMRPVGSGTKLRVELRTYHERVPKDFANLHQFVIRRATAENQSGFFQALTIIVVYLITVAMTLVDYFGVVRLLRLGLLLQLAGVVAQPHGPAHHDNFPLVGHHGDDGV